MWLKASTFEVDLPNDATWFYFTLLLAIALFFKFSRLLSMRNLDVISLFLLVPGLLLVRENPPNWYGYLWLACGSVFFLIRCLIDLALVRRPALAPNLALGGLLWLAGSLFLCIVTFACRQRDEGLVGLEPAALKQGKHQVEATAAEAIPQERTNVQFWVGRTLAILCHLGIVAGLIIIGWRHFQDLHSGTAAATFYLLLPYTALHVWQTHHVWPAVLMVWAVAAYRLPTLSGSLLGLAAGTSYFPVLALPIWLSFYRGRGAGRFAGAFVLTGGACLAMIATALWFGGTLAETVNSAFLLSDWQPWKVPHTPGLWEGIHPAYRLPVFLGYLALVIGVSFWPSPKNLAHVLALTAAALIGIQFWYAREGGVYVLWYLPLLLLVVFRPNLLDRQPQPIQPETDWLHRYGKTLLGWVHRFLKPATPQPAEK